MSRISTDTLEMDMPEHPSSVLDAVWPMVARPSLASASSPASSVTRWGLFQFPLVNLRDDLSAERPGSPVRTSVMVTLAVGFAASTTS